MSHFFPSAPRPTRRRRPFSVMGLFLLGPWKGGRHDGLAFIAPTAPFGLGTRPRGVATLGSRRERCGRAGTLRRNSPRLATRIEEEVLSRPAMSDGPPPRLLDGSGGGGVGGGPSRDVQLYFDEFNFCLDPKDSALSGPTLTKTLNKLTNEVVKNILILNSAEDAVPAGRQLVALRARFLDEHGADPAVAAGLEYLDYVTSLGLAAGGCPTRERLEKLEGRFHEAFSRVASVLGDFGCVVAEGVSGRVAPKDKDICLSVLDYSLTVETRTRALNAIANRVCRTICVGNDDDLAALAREMEARRGVVLARWLGARWPDSQEDKFYRSLAMLLTRGFADAPPELHGPYSNAYKRLVDVLVQEVGTRSAPASDKVLDSFVRWERDLRKNLTEPMWDALPRDLVGSWALGDDYSQVGLGLEPDLPRRRTGLAAAATAAAGSGAADAAGAAAAAGAATTAESTAGGGSDNDDDGLSSPWGLAGIKQLVVTFQSDGSVVVAPDAGIGLRWRLEPGPTHLDTIYFE
ncbi:unnamed protein product, partial [Phaeothamnion confervicola]